jgi:SAM-dependent methyltransferase
MIFIQMDFWDKYYNEEIKGDSPLTDEASSFAMFIAPHLEPNCTLIDLGAGNGRDTNFFAQKGMKVVACDQANSLKNKSIPFLCRSMDAIEDQPFDCAYSRFSLHSITEEQQHKVFQWVGRNCKWFFIETRSVHDPRYGKGRQVAKDAFEETHYRRFTALDDLIKEAQKIGFEVVHAAVDFTSAWYKDDKAVVNRLILKASPLSSKTTF